MIQTISIITPVKNGIQYFEDCIWSILSQRGAFNIQYIVVDALSEDGSYELAHKFSESLRLNQFPQGCHSIEMQIIREDDQGMYDAIAKGFKLCNGDIVAYLNADDYYLQGAFAKVVECFQKNEHIHWLTGKPLSVDSDRNVIYSVLPFSYNLNLIRMGYYGKRLPFIQQENVFFRKHLIDLIDFKLFTSLRLAGDFYLWKCFAMKHHLYILTKSLSTARIHPNRLSSDITLYFEEFDKISETKTLWSYPFAAWHLLLNVFLSNKLKSRFSPFICLD